MIGLQHFAAAMTRLGTELPMQKNYDSSVVADLWENFPMGAKIHLTPEALHFAVGQRILDPAPPKEIAAHNRLLHYVFPMVDGVPTFTSGLRSDLNERLSDPERFHDPARRPELQRPKALPASRDGWHPGQMEPEERLRALQRAKSEIERLVANGPDEETLSLAALRSGERIFYAAIVTCFIPFDERNIAATWARRNSKKALEALDNAIKNDQPELLPTAAQAVVNIMGFHPAPETDEEVFA